MRGKKIKKVFIWRVQMKAAKTNVFGGNVFFWDVPIFCVFYIDKNLMFMELLGTYELSL